MEILNRHSMRSSHVVIQRSTTNLQCIPVKYVDSSLGPHLFTRFILCEDFRGHKKRGARERRETKRGFFVLSKQSPPSWHHSRNRLSSVRPIVNTSCFSLTERRHVQIDDVTGVAASETHPPGQYPRILESRGGFQARHPLLLASRLTHAFLITKHQACYAGNGKANQTTFVSLGVFGGVLFLLFFVFFQLDGPKKGTFTPPYKVRAKSKPPLRHAPVMAL